MWSPAFERATATVVGAVICQPGGEEEEEEEKESNEQSQREEPGQHAKQKTWHILKSSSCIHYYLDGSGSSHAMSHPRGLLRGLYRGSLLQTAQELFWGLYLPVHEQVQKHVTANIKWNIIRAQLGRVTVRPDKQHPEECYFFTYQAERDRIGDPEQNTQGMAAPVDIGERGLGTTRSQGMSQVLLSSPPLSTPVPGHHVCSYVIPVNIKNKNNINTAAAEFTPPESGPWSRPSSPRLCDVSSITCDLHETWFGSQLGQTQAIVTAANEADGGEVAVRYRPRPFY